MSRRPTSPATRLTLDFGSPAVVVAAAIRPVAAFAFERISRAVPVDADQRLIDMWLHGNALHMQRAYKRAAAHYLGFVGKLLRAMTFGDF